MLRYDWMEEEMGYFFKVIKKKKEKISNAMQKKANILSCRTRITANVLHIIQLKHQQIETVLCQSFRKVFSEN